MFLFKIQQAFNWFGLFTTCLVYPDLLNQPICLDTLYFETSYLFILHRFPVETAEGDHLKLNLINKADQSQRNSSKRIALEEINHASAAFFHQISTAAILCSDWLKVPRWEGLVAWPLRCLFSARGGRNPEAIQKHCALNEHRKHLSFLHSEHNYFIFLVNRRKYEQNFFFPIAAILSLSLFRCHSEIVPLKPHFKRSCVCACSFYNSKLFLQWLHWVIPPFN